MVVTVVVLQEATVVEKVAEPIPGEYLCKVHLSISNTMTHLTK